MGWSRVIAALVAIRTDPAALDAWSAPGSTLSSIRHRLPTRFDRSRHLSVDGIGILIVPVSAVLVGHAFEFVSCCIAAASTAVEAAASRLRRRPRGGRRGRQPDWGGAGRRFRGSI